MKQPENRNEDRGDEERGKTKKNKRGNKGNYRREEARKYRETASAAFPLRACPERTEGPVEGRCAAAVKKKEKVSIVPPNLRVSAFLLEVALRP
ncbi:MAG: hypothetical protein K2P88_18055 [Chitinophagaceae bacterium]|nr:hypothetical protein [Chitinophagaceae bacterium]